jgi:hypothetical protein
MYYYTYYSYEEFGRGYIGSRKSKVSPEQDISYFGSYKDKTFKPTQKIILTTYQTREEALAAEIRLHEFYDVANNPHFANQAKQTSEKFYVPTEKAKKHGKKLYELGLGVHGLTEEERIENGKKVHELGLGVHSRTKEQMTEHGKRGGKKGGKRVKELGVGIHAQTKEEHIEWGKKTYELGIGIHGRSKEQMSEDGKMGGNKCKELELGIHALSKEERVEAGKKGGTKSKELGLGVHSRTKEQMTENGKRGGKKTRELGLGIYSLTIEERIDNAKKAGQISAEKNAREFILMDPYGNIHQGRNINQFCKKHGLIRSNIGKVLKGTQSHHKGWTKPIDNALTDILFS